MSHDFLGLTTKESLDIERDKPVSLNARLTDDLKNSIKQLRNLQKKTTTTTTTNKGDGLHSSEQTAQGGASHYIKQQNGTTMNQSSSSSTTQSGVVGGADLNCGGNEEPRKLVKVHLWVNEENPLENRIIELDSMRSFQINPTFLGYDAERLRCDPLQRRIKIDISVTSNQNLFKSFEIPEAPISLLDVQAGLNAVSRIQQMKQMVFSNTQSTQGFEQTVVLPRILRQAGAASSKIKSKRMLMAMNSTIIKKGKVFSIKYLQNEDQDQD